MADVQTIQGDDVVSEREMILEIIVGPTSGVAGITLGMPLARARNIIQSLPGYNVAASTPMISDFTTGVSIALESDSDDRVKSIEIYRPESGAEARVVCIFRGMSIFEEPAQEIIRELSLVERGGYYGRGASCSGSQAALGFVASHIARFPRGRRR